MACVQYTVPRIPASTLLSAALVAALSLTGACAADAAEPESLQEALNQGRQAVIAHDIEGARRLFRHAETLEGEDEDAAEVQRRLAVLEWRFFDQASAARKRLVRATQGPEPGEAWVALARMEQHLENHAAAREAARRAAGTAQRVRTRFDARAALAEAVVEPLLQRRLQGKALPPEAAADLNALLDDFRSDDLLEGFLEPSRRILQAALLLDDGPAMLEAWRSYYHGPAGENGLDAVAAAGRVLAETLPGWRDSGSADGASSTRRDIAVVKGLAGSRFFREAAAVALDPASPEGVRANREVREILGYRRYIDNLREIFDTHYMRCIHGDCDGGRLTRNQRAEDERFEEELEGILGSRPEGTLALYLEQRFGLHQTAPGKTAGYSDMHMGHAVIDVTRAIEQYGKQADLRFVSLDLMVSNGFQSWAWEDGRAHGGWAKVDKIYKVRSAYVSDTVGSWNAFQSPEEVERFEARMKRESAADDDRSRRDPHAFLPGLGMRLTHQAVKRKLAELQSDTDSEEPLRVRFISEIGRIIQASSIFAHEGRHAIDAGYLPSSRPTWRKEFTAKLSQVAFAEEPRMSLGSILSPNIGNSTPHGRANLEIVKGLIAWMEAHREDIEGFDAARPVMPQLDLLSDDQLRAAFRSMDPLAKEAAREASQNAAR